MYFSVIFSQENFVVAVFIAFLDKYCKKSGFFKSQNSLATPSGLELIKIPLKTFIIISDNPASLEATIDLPTIAVSKGAIGKVSFKGI